MFKNKSSILAAYYLRLSRDDGDKAESDSISNQRNLISDYVSQHEEITFVEEYVDDGYSGTNFDRPAFQKMMKDAKNKKINCIIVKDLSRLGRNYIETGRYLEKVFPFLDIRFIAITDHYDTADQTNDSDQIIVPFKNLINDAYCRDISIKIRSQLDVKRKTGQFIGSFAAYGYCKDPADKNRLVIDETAAEVVQLIFRLKLEGFSSTNIADRLNELGIPTPMEYKRRCGLNFNSGFRSGNSPKWIAVSVNRILKNELYTGTMVQGKNQKINYKVKQSRAIEEKDWIRVEKTHEAIIPQEIFQCVQDIMLLDTRTSPKAESVYLFSGILKCSDCGQNMVRRTATKKGKKYFYYHCSTYKNGDGCSSHIISEKKMMETVIRAVQNQIAVVDNVDSILKRMEHLPEEKISVKVLDKQICSLQKEVERYKDMKVRLYQDFQDGVVSRNEFQEINQRFHGKMEAAREKKGKVENKKKQLLSQGMEPQAWMQEFQKYRNVKTLDRRMVVTLIEKIVVHGKDEVEIHFNYEDELLDIMEIVMENDLPDREKGVAL